MPKIYITESDRDHLKQLLEARKPHDDFDEALLYEIDRAEVLDLEDMPRDVITMNSRIKFTDDHGDTWDLTLVYPEEADLPSGKVSVLSPIGSALLGYRVGDKVTVFTGASGRRDLIVEEIVSQPEHDGEFDK